MKKYLLILFVFTSLVSSAQKIEKYYDYNWRPCEPITARFYALIEFKDGLWSRHDYFLREKTLQMQGSYRDSACKMPEGVFYFFHPNKILSQTGKYINGKKDGAWMSYYSNGLLQDSTVYDNGHPTGLSLGWHRGGYLSDSSSYKENGISVHVSWFDNGAPSFAGRKINDTLQGKWTYYHKNGNLSAMEVYDHGKLTSRKYFDEAGSEISDTTNHDRSVEFNGGSKAWNKYMLSKLYFPNQFKITGGDKAVVVVDAVIDEEGNIESAEVSVPFYRDFDDIALKMMKGSPKWKPAINHNRKVKAYIRQPVTFAQE